MVDSSWKPLFDRFAALKATWPARAWSWDSRLMCVTSSFAVEVESKARAAALEALPLEYTAATLARAGTDLRRVAERTGGLVADVDDDTVVTEGFIRAIQRGDIATSKGYLVDDEAASYLVTSRVVIFWPFNEAGLTCRDAVERSPLIV